MKEDIRKQAIEYAKGDIGLTQEEAEEAFDNHYPDDYNNYCENCGVLLDERKNCNDDMLDCYCNKCWKVLNESLKNFKKNSK